MTYFSIEHKIMIFWKALGTKQDWTSLTLVLSTQMLRYLSKYLRGPQKKVRHRFWNKIRVSQWWQNLYFLGVLSLIAYSKTFIDRAVRSGCVLQILANDVENVHTVHSSCCKNVPHHVAVFHFAHTSGCYRHTLTLHTVCVIRSHTSLHFLLLYLLLSACLSSSVVKLRETQPARLRKHRRRLASIYSSISSHFVRTLTCNLISSLPHAGEFAPEVCLQLRWRCRGRVEQADWELWDFAAWSSLAISHTLYNYQKSVPPPCSSAW